jgi:hypothetical protein
LFGKFIVKNGTTSFRARAKWTLALGRKVTAHEIRHRRAARTRAAPT